MTNRTLAYTKSPKTSKRTTFQDELQAAVSARASKTKSDHYSYSDDFDEDEEDFLNELLKSRKKKTEAFQAGKSKAKIHNFELSDDEDKHGKTKRVSFLKTQRISFPSDEVSESRENEPPDSPSAGHSNSGDSFSSQHSANVGEYDTHCEYNIVQPVDPQVARDESSKSPLHQTSDDTLLLPSTSVTETPDPEESNTVPARSSETPIEPDLQHVPSAGSVTERGPPKPKPRQRTLGFGFQAVEKPPREAETQDLSRPQTSSASIPPSTGTRSWSPHAKDEDGPSLSHCLSKSSSNKSEQSWFLTKSTVDSESKGDLTSDDSKDQERSLSLIINEELGDHLHHSVAQLSHTQEKSFGTMTSSSLSKTPLRSQSACFRNVESKYLGTLKVLDRKVSLQESQPQAADSLRAAIYQEWLKKKKEKLRESMQIKKKEELLQEQKKKEEESKKEDAIASYEAWKEKKAESLKAKAKEKQDMMRKVQRASEEKEEKRQSSQLVFEKWKQEHDHRLKEKYRKQKEEENKLKLKIQKKEKEREKGRTSAFSNWSEKKKDVLHEKAMIEREKNKNKAEEERYMKEEKDIRALHVHEYWLVRKDLEQKRQREERQIKSILQDSPPPPWSPPNKTISFLK